MGGGNCLLIPVQSENRQENIPFRFQKIQIASDGADAPRLPVWKIDHMDPVLFQNVFDAPLQTVPDADIVAEGRLLIHKPHHTVGVAGHVVFQGRDQNYFRLEQLLQFIHQLFSGNGRVFRKDAVTDNGCFFGWRENHIPSIQVDARVYHRKAETRRNVPAKIRPQFGKLCEIRGLIAKGNQLPGACLYRHKVPQPDILGVGNILNRNAMQG